MLYFHVFQLLITTYQNNTTIYTTGLFCSACTFLPHEKYHVVCMYTFLFMLNLISLVCFCIVLDFLVLNFQLHFDNYTFWDARIVPLYCTFTPCSIIFNITFVFAKLYKVHEFQKTWKFKLRKNCPIYILHPHAAPHSIVRRVVTKNDKTNCSTFTNSLNGVCVFETVIWTFNDMLTLRMCDFGAPKQVDWNAARSLRCNFFFEKVSD